MKDEQMSLFKNGEIRGLMDYPYCPNCNKALIGYVNQCEYCGQLITWDRWMEYLIREGVWDE